MNKFAHGSKVPHVIAGGLFLFIVLLSIVATSGSGSDTQPATTDASATATPDPTPVETLPLPEDFTADLVVLEKSCYGSAGCLVTYRVTPDYVGSQDLTGRKFTVIYEVVGAVDETVEQFTTDGHTARYDAEDMVQTAKSANKLEVTILQVLEN